MKSPERDELIKILKARFEKNMHRHRSMAWAAVQAKLERNLHALTSLRAMEASGGEPDVIGDDKSGHVTFYDCSAEGRLERHAQRRMGRAAGGTPWLLYYRSRTVIRAAHDDDTCRITRS